MRNISSAVLSLVAMALSSLTTYLTFFDARYTLTGAVANAEANWQTGASSNSGKISVNYRPFVAVNVILSNRGTRPLVLSDVHLVESSDREKCKATGKPLQRSDPALREATIVEPETVQQLRMPFSLPGIDREIVVEDPYAADFADFDLKDTTKLWCLRWTVFDRDGKRREPMMPALTTTFAFTPAEPDEYRPDMDMDIDYPKAPRKLVSRGLF